MLIQDVPNEIMVSILSMLPRASMKQCLLVSKLWYFTAARVRYSDITLANNNIEKFISTYLTNRQNPTDIQFWVKHLQLDMIEYSALPLQHNFFTLISCLKNLETIDIQSLPDESAIGCLNQIRSAFGSLKDLKEVKVNESMCLEGKKVYLRTVFTYRNTISCLHLNYLRTIDNLMTENRTITYMDFLPQFENLTYLTVFNDMSIGDPHMNIHLVLNMCPKLKKFTLMRPSRLFWDASLPKLLSLLTQDALEAKQLQLPSKRKNVNLKHLHFHLQTLDGAYMKYILLYTHLYTFSLHMASCNFFDWLVKEQDIVHQFARYLHSVKSLEIVAISPVNSRIQRKGLMREQIQLQELHKQQQGSDCNTVKEDRIQKHWEFLATVVDSSSVHCHLFLCSETDEYGLQFQDFRMKVDYNFLELNYGLSPEYPHNNLNLFLMQPSIVINSFEVGDVSRYSLEDCLEALQTALTNCPDLELLLLNRAELCYRLEFIPYPYNIDFDHFKLEHGESLKYFKRYKRYRSKKQKSLNHIFINNADLTPTLTQVLCTHLPQTKILKLKNSVIQQGENNTAIINLRNMRHLHYLQVEIVHQIVEPPNPASIVTIELSDRTLYYQSQDYNFVSVTVEQLSTHSASHIVIQCDIADELVFSAPIINKISSFRLLTNPSCTYTSMEFQIKSSHF